MAAFDYKKEYKEFYMPKAEPAIVTIPPMNYISVRGRGDPNAEDGEYKEAIGLLYGVAYTIKTGTPAPFVTDLSILEAQLPTSFQGVFHALNHPINVF